MTAAELILELQKLKPDMRIVIRGYENGYNDILQLRPVKIKLNMNEHWYEGAHDTSTAADTVDAIDLSGENKNAKD